jgi:predicted amidohydrolase YtcJ
MMRQALGLMAASLLLAANSAPADMILHNGAVRTPTGWAAALAIRDGVIVAVGDDAATAPYRGTATRMVDLGGAAVLPGLHDMHVHAQFAGLEQSACGFPYGAKPDVIATKVKACATKAAPGEWIVGGNWVGAVFAKGQQNRQFLDRAAPDNPVLLNDEAHHSIWVNSAALRLAGVTRDTPDPAGGIIERDAKGEPTGLFRENAMRLVEKVLPEPGDAVKREALTLSTNQMLSYGIIAFEDATVRKNNIATFAALAAQGKLKQYVRGCIVWAPGDKDGEELIARRAEYARGRFSTNCVKIFMDGVPTESHTAAMLAPYEPSDKHAHGGTGMLLIPQPVLNKAVADFDRMGLHIKFHAVGDGAVRAAIDAVEHARTINGRGGSSHELGHNTFVDMADFARARDLGLTWEFSPYIWYPTPITSVDIQRAVGDERMRRFIPIRDALDSGANVVAGSDWSVVPSVNPWLAIETMVTRQSPGASGPAIAPDERVTLDQALTMFTSNAARLMGYRDKTGSIETGMRADIIVTRQNPYKEPIGRLHATQVLMTFIDGEKVFDAASPPKLTAD